MKNSFGVIKIANLVANLLRKIKKRDDSVRVIIREFSILESKVRKLAEIDNDLTTMMDELKLASTEVKPQIDEYFQNKKEHMEYLARRETRVVQQKLDEALKENKELKRQLIIKEVVDDGSVEKAKTLAIFDSIIASISNWSTDGQTAPDVELIFQSILFPLVYEPVCKGNKDYYLQEVPYIAYEVVKRGREYIADLRERFNAFINTKEAWMEYAPEIQEWLVNDALPLIYGARDDDWQVKRAYPFGAMTVWRDEPHQRIRDFPLIFDGMELVAQRSEEIREAKIAQFELETLSTRIEL